MPTDDSTLHVGAAQAAEVFMDQAATVEKDCEFIREAGDLDLDLLVFPEFHIPAAPGWYRYVEDSHESFYEQLFDEAVTVPGPAVDRLCEAAAEAGAVVVIGVTEKESDQTGTMYNSLVFIDADGTLLGVRRKLMPTAVERLFHTGGTGDDVRTFESSLGTLGGMMCGEHTNHLLGYAILAQGEALHAATWPAFPQYKQPARETRVGIRTRFHAFAGGVPTACATGVVTKELANAIGVPDLATDSGMSSIIAPSGEYLAGPKWVGEGIVHAEVDMGDWIRSKATHDVTGHYNRFDIFSLTVNRQAHDPIRFVDGRGQDVERVAIGRTAQELDDEDEVDGAAGNDTGSRGEAE